MTDQIPENDNILQQEDPGTEYAEGQGPDEAGETPSYETGDIPAEEPEEAPAGEPDETPADEPAKPRAKKPGALLIGIVSAALVLLVVFLAFVLPALVGGGSGAASKYQPAPTATPIRAESSSGWSYVLENGRAVITGYSGSDANIPATLDGHRVTAIGENALPYKSSVTLPEGITEIRRDAFRDGSFIEIELPASLTTIEELAFHNCSGLTSIRIPAGVRNVTGNPFVGCLNLVSIRVAPDHPALAVKDGILYSKTDRRLICLPFNIVATDRFRSVTRRQASEEEIANHTSWGSVYGLEQDPENPEVYYFVDTDYVCTVPDRITAIGSYAFAGCEALTRVVLPGSVTSVGDYAFSGCYNLKALALNSGVKTVGDYAFAGCSGMQSVNLPDTLTSIGCYAFSGCGGLSGVRIPNAVSKIGDNPFVDCRMGLILEVDGGHSHLQLVDDVLYAKADRRLVYCPTGKSAENLTIQEGTKIIGAKAFAGANSLREITLPNSVTEIREDAFRDLSNLETVRLPDSLTVIGDRAFYRCRSLKSIAIPARVQTVGKRAFCECGHVTEITIANGVRAIQDNAFESCSDMDITLPASVEYVGRNAFNGSAKLTVTRGSRALQYLSDYDYDYAGYNADDWLGR